MFERIYPMITPTVKVGDIVHFKVYEQNGLKIRKVVGMLVKVDYSPLGPNANGFAVLVNIDGDDSRGFAFTDRISLTESHESTTVDNINKTLYLQTFPIMVTKVFRPSGTGTLVMDYDSCENC